VDTQGHVLVSDMENHRVQWFEADGGYLGQAGSLGLGCGEFNRPTGVAFNPQDGLWYVADYGNHRLHALDSTGQCVEVIAGRGPGQGQLLFPRGVACAFDGRVYVADTGNNLVQALERRWRVWLPAIEGQHEGI